LQFTTSDGLELFYEFMGNGRIPCIYLHGGPGYWSKPFQYYSQDLLGEKLDMVYLDQRGCGRSDKSPTNDYSLHRLIDDIEELRITLGVKQWYVMGHSFGGILAVNYANSFPHRTKGIILSNVTLNMIDSFSHQIKKATEILGIAPIELPLIDMNRLMDTFYSVITKLMDQGEYFKFQYKNIINKTKIDAMDKELDIVPDFQQFVFSTEEYFQDFTRMTANLSMPVLVITGEYDDAVGPSHYRSFHFIHSKVTVLKSSHHPYLENPFEFKDAILNFVKE
jgi:proline iminopeptidase